MKRVAIFRFSADDGPGYFASFLDRHSIPWQLYRLDQGDALPTDLDQFSGFAFMGGGMSANDCLTWTQPVLLLMRDAIDRDQPCIGHCLGGQLMAKALGGKVTVNAVKEIGWNPVVAENSPIAREWLCANIADAAHFTAFQWHGETFSIPAGATRILTGQACDNQAYVFGNSLGMQCHTEMTADMIEEWCGDWAAENAPRSPTVQSPEEMREALNANLLKLRVLADRLYLRWTAGLPRDERG